MLFVLFVAEKKKVNIAIRGGGQGGVVKDHTLYIKNGKNMVFDHNWGGGHTGPILGVRWK